MNAKIFVSEEPDPIGMLLGTGYNRFESKQGVGGLAKENGRRLDILAVHSLVEGNGMFRDFIKVLKQEYDTICIWEVWNKNLPDILKRYGFLPETELQGDGEILNGFRWDKETITETSCPSQNPTIQKAEATKI